MTTAAVINAAVSIQHTMICNSCPVIVRSDDQRTPKLPDLNVKAGQFIVDRR
jgi:hypothetical protein